VDPQVPCRRKSRAQFKQIRNWRNRRARKEVLNIINRLLDQITESLANSPPVFPSFSSPHIFSPISEERFPSTSRYDSVFSPISSPLPRPSPIYDSLSLVSLPLLPDVSPLSPLSSSTSSVEFLDEIPAPSSSLQSYDFEELPFISIAIHFLQFTSPSPPEAYTVGLDGMNLGDLRRSLYRRSQSRDT